MKKPNNPDQQPIFRLRTVTDAERSCGHWTEIDLYTSVREIRKLNATPCGVQCLIKAKEERK